jgi:hypothetical protein
MFLKQILDSPVKLCYTENTSKWVYFFALIFREPGRRRESPDLVALGKIRALK